VHVRTYVQAKSLSNVQLILDLKYIEERNSNYVQRDYYKEKNTRHAILFVLHVVREEILRQPQAVFGRHLYLHLPP